MSSPRKKPMLYLPSLNDDEISCYSRISNLIHLRDYMLNYGIPCTILDLELKTDTAFLDFEAVEFLYNHIRDMVLVDERHLHSAWKMHARHRRDYPEFATNLCWDSFRPGNVEDFEGDDAMTTAFHHPDPRVKVFLKHLSETRLDAKADADSSNALHRTCYVKVCDGITYSFSNSFKCPDRADILRCLILAEKEKRFVLPQTCEKPDNFPNEDGVGLYTCFVEQSVSHTSIVCDALGKYTGVVDGTRISPKTDRMPLLFTGDGQRLISCIQEDADRILHVYRATLPGMPRLKKRVYTLTNLEGKVTAPHIVCWIFDAPSNGETWNGPEPHGNARRNMRVYQKTDKAALSKAKQIFRNIGVGVKSAREQLSEMGYDISYSSLKHTAHAVRGKVGALKSRNHKTNLDELANLEKLPGIEYYVFDRNHGPTATTKNVVVVDTRMLEIAASCQPSLKELKKRKDIVEELLADASKYRKFMDDLENVSHDESGYWRVDGKGGAWAMDTTYDLSDYYITMLVAELPHIRTSDGSKRSWVPVAYVGHIHRDGDTMEHCFFHLCEIFRKSMDGVKRCPATLITDADSTLGRIFKFAPFQETVHGHCDFHLLCNFSDSGMKSLKKRRGNNNGEIAPVRKHRELVVEDADDSGRSDEEVLVGPAESLENSETRGVNPVGTDDVDSIPGRKRNAKLQRHYRTTSVLFGKVLQKTDLNKRNDLVLKFRPGAIWARTFELFLEEVKRSYENAGMDEDDYFYFMKRSVNIYQYHGPKFRLILGRSTMFNTTNPIEGTFRRIKQAIGKGQRVLNVLYSDLHRYVSEIYNDIVLAVTGDGYGCRLKTAKPPVSTLEAMDERDARSHLHKYGLPDDILLKKNFGRPLPEDFFDAICAKQRRGAFVKEVEELWTANKIGKNQLVISKSEHFDSYAMLELKDDIVACRANPQCKRFCRHIVIGLALFPPELNRDKYVHGCLMNYFGDVARYHNGRSAGNGCKGGRKFTTQSGGNQQRPIMGKMRPALYESTDEDDGSALLSQTHGIPPVPPTAPTERPHAARNKRIYKLRQNRVQKSKDAITSRSSDDEDDGTALLTQTPDIAPARPTKPTERPRVVRNQTTYRLRHKLEQKVRDAVTSSSSDDQEYGRALLPQIPDLDPVPPNEPNEEAFDVSSLDTVPHQSELSNEVQSFDCRLFSDRDEPVGCARVSSMPMDRSDSLHSSKLSEKSCKGDHKDVPRRRSARSCKRPESYSPSTKKIKKSILKR